MLTGAAWAGELQQKFEEAYYLETAKAQTQEALAIYSQIVQSEVTDETRPVIIQSLERMLVLHKRQRDQTFQAKMANFDWYPDNRSRIVDVFGEPESYLWINKVYTKETLPGAYSMQYPNGLAVSMMSGKISNFSLKNPTYTFKGLTVGCDLEDVLAVFPPVRIADGERKVHSGETGVLYKNYTDTEGAHTYRTPEGVRFHFAKDKLYSITFSSPRTFSFLPSPVVAETE